MFNKILYEKEFEKSIFSDLCIYGEQFMLNVLKYALSLNL